MDRLQEIRDVLSSIYHRIVFDVEGQCPEDLLSGLKLLCPAIPAKEWPDRLSFGGVYLNGRPVTKNRSLATPCRLEYYEPKFSIKNAAAEFPRFDPASILYEDEDLLAVDKPCGLPSVPSKEQKIYNLKQYIHTYLGHTAHLPSRLDTSTRGLVVLSKSQRMHGPLQRIFEKRKAKKRYLLVTGSPVLWESLDATEPMGRSTLHPVLRTVREDGKSAHTHFKRLSGIESPEGATLIEAQPLSGRTHQIRVHAHHHGFPILGDRFYEGAPASSLHLLSWKLSLMHPFTNRHIEFAIPEERLPEWAAGA